MSLLQQDTLHHAQPVVETPATDELTTEETPSVVSQPAPMPKKLTPYQVLRQLPADATPAQQDSAIQANFHPENTHLSERPDTLHLPGHDKGKSYKEELATASKKWKFNLTIEKNEVSEEGVILLITNLSPLKGVK